jgi:predicted RNase H-like nuclease (RuvC/YqgF family)
LDRITATKENELESLLQDLGFKDESVTVHKNKLELVAQSETQAKEDLISARNRITELENEIEAISEQKRILQEEVERCTSRIRKLETQLESSREERKRFGLFINF